MHSQHPDIRPRLEGMKAEIKYNALAEGINALDERKDAKGIDTMSYVISGGATLESCHTFVLRTVLTHSPNSCPPGRLVGIFNATFDADQMMLFGDYIELSMRSQYNSRDM